MYRRPSFHCLSEAQLQYRQGKIKYIGLSECTANDLRRAHAIHPIAALEVEYNPFALEVEEVGLLETARELGIAIIAYSPLGRGLLSGQIVRGFQYP